MNFAIPNDSVFVVEVIKACSTFFRHFETFVNC